MCVCVCVCVCVVVVMVVVEERMRTPRQAQVSGVVPTGIPRGNRGSAIKKRHQLLGLSAVVVGALGAHDVFVVVLQLLHANVATGVFVAHLEQFDKLRRATCM